MAAVRPVGDVAISKYAEVLNAERESFEGNACLSKRRKAFDIMMVQNQKPKNRDTRKGAARLVRRVGFFNEPLPEV